MMTVTSCPAAAAGADATIDENTSKKQIWAVHDLLPTGTNFLPRCNPVGAWIARSLMALFSHLKCYKG